jgi:hypothetical protein
LALMPLSAVTSAWSNAKRNARTVGLNVRNLAYALLQTGEVKPMGTICSSGRSVTRTIPPIEGQHATAMKAKQPHQKNKATPANEPAAQCCDGSATLNFCQAHEPIFFE